jgi:hypothetical protein
MDTMMLWTISQKDKSFIIPDMKSTTSMTKMGHALPNPLSSSSSEDQPKTDVS